MKEFIEKLIGRLEELKTFKLDLADAMSELMKKDRLDNYISKEEVVEIVNQLAEEYNNGWIPCSVELPPQPEENPEFEGKLLELYMVAMREEKYPFRAFWNGRNFTDGISVVKPIAWKPLDIFQKGENK